MFLTQNIGSWAHPNICVTFSEGLSGSRFNGCIRNIALNGLELRPEEVFESTTSDVLINGCPKF